MNVCIIMLQVLPTFNKEKEIWSSCCQELSFSKSSIRDRTVKRKYGRSEISTCLLCPQVRWSLPRRPLPRRHLSPSIMHQTTSSLSKASMMVCPINHQSKPSLLSLQWWSISSYTSPCLVLSNINDSPSHQASVYAYQSTSTSHKSQIKSW